ncbi:unnamed protein product [Rhizoctonia solani]|uniref:CHAT domain-containing protein n=1 Tax=Rhizoctonia solani TaxID=456999 RepID=A0A8H3CEZ8_9AGAM|nr:unnamed protein product [Rhizoctonia solani]
MGEGSGCESGRAGSPKGSDCNNDKSWKEAEAEQLKVQYVNTDDERSAEDLRDLARSHLEKYDNTGALSELEQTFEYYYASSIARAPDEHASLQLAERLTNLGAVYSDRFDSLGELEDLDGAIRCDARALALTPDGHPDISRRHASLGMSYTNRYQHLGELADLEKAIEYKARALELTPDGHPDMSDRHAGLGVSYGHRYERLGNLADLEKTIECETRALALTPDDHPDMSHHHANLGMSYTDRYKRLGDLADLEKAIICDTRAIASTPDGHPDMSARYDSLGTSYRDRYKRLGNLADLEKVIEYFTRALALTPDGHPDMSRRHAALGVAYTDQYQRLGDLADLEKAIECDTTALVLTPDASRRSYRPTQPVASDSMTPEQVGQQRRRLASEYHTLIAQIHQIPGFESFLQPLKADRLLPAVRSGPVVVLNCHTDRCDALIIMPGHDQVTHLPLPSFTEHEAQLARSQLDGSLAKKGQRQRGVKLRNPISYEEGFETVLGTLWSDIVQPVLSYLGYLDDTPRDRLPHITWCPTGLLTFLPLHAAGDYSQPQSRVFNYAISSYTPTLSALLASTPSQFNRRCQVLAIGQASTPGQNRLPGTTKELAHVKAHTHNKTEYSQLTDSQATTAAVLDAMEQHDWVHLARHASQNCKDPIKSGFHLHDGTLDLSTISQRSFKNKGLAFLSACQTATGDENLPDEAIHLASGMLMSGYPSVIATMWSVDDNDAPLVADKVYAQLMKGGMLGNGEAGRALHYAVAELREKVKEKEFGRWVPYIHIGS